MEDTALVVARNARYRVVENPALRRAETRVIGADYGTNSYTTRSQADFIGRLLELEPGKVFLDLGSGAGWPGIYLAATSGARVVLTDIPVEGLRVATRRLRADAVAGHALGAGGAALPFADHSFDSIISSDVFC